MSLPQRESIGIGRPVDPLIQPARVRVLYARLVEESLWIAPVRYSAARVARVEIPPHHQDGMVAGSETHSTPPPDAPAQPVRQTSSFGTPR